MSESNQAELLRVLELDYEQTTKSIEGILSSTFTIRGWGITLSSALIGLTFQQQQWEIAVLAIVVTLLVAFVDGYHSWLYAKVLQHANSIETVLRSYYKFLARGDADPEPEEDFRVKIEAHRFGRFTEIQKGFSLASLREARPQKIIIVLYATLLVCAIVSGGLVLAMPKKPAMSFECTSVSGTTNAFLCKLK